MWMDLKEEVNNITITLELAASKAEIRSHEGSSELRLLGHYATDLIAVIYLCALCIYQFG